jgi:hypothetical protein
MLAFYVLYAAVMGRIYVKSGPWGRVVYREESTEYFWISVVIYAGLAVALVAFFNVKHNTALQRDAPQAARP